MCDLPQCVPNALSDIGGTSMQHYALNRDAGKGIIYMRREQLVPCSVCRLNGRLGGEVSKLSNGQLSE
jgi:hypothetical protein